MAQFKEADGPGPKREIVGYGRYVPKVTWPDGARVVVMHRPQLGRGLGVLA